MAHLIDKDTLVVEIERLQCPEHKYCLDKLLDFLDTLEVKEVDLEEEMDKYYDSPLWDGENVSWMTYTEIARHFYSLGLAQKGE